MLWILRREASPRDVLDFADAREQLAEIGARREVAPVGVHRLAEQGHLAAALGGEPADLLDDDCGRTAAPAPPRLRHDAEGAAFLAPLHDRPELSEPPGG